MVLFLDNEIDNVNVDTQRFIEQTFAYFAMSREELEQLDDGADSLNQDADNSDAAFPHW